MPIFGIPNTRDAPGRDEIALVHYYGGAKENLRRVVKEQHKGWFLPGTTLEKCATEKETLDEWYDEELEEEFGSKWDYFAGMEKTKIYGIHANPQLGEEDILDILESNKVLLLQIGEDITEEGTLSFFIEKIDLENKNFENCKAVWAQT